MEPALNASLDAFEQMVAAADKMTDRLKAQGSMVRPMFRTEFETEAKRLANLAEGAERAVAIYETEQQKFWATFGLTGEPMRTRNIALMRGAIAHGIMYASCVLKLCGETAADPSIHSDGYKSARERMLIANNQLARRA